MYFLLPLCSLLKVYCLQQAADVFSSVCVKCRSEWIGDQLACSGYYGVIGTPEGSFTMVLEGLE